MAVDWIVEETFHRAWLFDPKGLCCPLSQDSLDLWALQRGPRMDLEHTGSVMNPQSSLRSSLRL
jgi:hypothetical protein